VGIRDPIDDSYDHLVESLRQFNEKYSIEKFCQGFTALLVTQKQENISNYVEKFVTKEENAIRAKIFILSCFNLD
jgi:hypothetical protein